MEETKNYEIAFHGRGGQGAITAAELLCQVAYEDGFADVLSVPIIGAERRGAPIKAFVKLSPKSEIKNLSAVTEPDVMVIFDMSLLTIPAVKNSLRKGIIILNTKGPVDKSDFPEGAEIYTVDATQISLKVGLVVSGSPVLNVPLLGAYAKALGHIKLESMEKVLEKRFGPKAALNFETAKLAYAEVQKVA